MAGCPPGDQPGEATVSSSLQIQAARPVLEHPRPQGRVAAASMEGNEHDAAKWILRAVSDNQRRVLAYLVSAGRDGVWTAELHHTAGYDAVTSMSGVFKVRYSKPSYRGRISGTA